MGLESIKIGKQLEPQPEPLKETIIERIGNDYLVTQTDHGPVYKGRNIPRYVRFNLLDTAHPQRIIRKQSIIFSENEQGYIDRKESIIHTARVLNGIKNKYLEDV